MSERATYPMTKGALENLRKELDDLIEVKKPELAARLKAAIAMGDLSENADYISAKEDQGFLEGRILDLKEIIQGAVIIEDNANSDGVIAIGSNVTIVENGTSDKETFRIVGKVEADPRNGLISDESPLGRALLGHVKGDQVTVDAPAGNIIFKVTKVS